MNQLQKQHSLALTKEQTELLQLLNRNELVMGVHSGVTSPLPAKKRTYYILGKMDLYTSIANLLQWQANDVDRAFRTVNTAELLRLLDLLSAVVFDVMSEADVIRFNRISPDLIVLLQRALDGGDSSRFGHVASTVIAKA